MSRDIFVQDIPSEALSIDDIPDEWTPSPLPYSADQVREAVLAVIPDADFSDPTWGHIERPGVDIEVNLHGDITDSFAFHVRASDEVAAEAVIAAVLSSLGLRAFDPVGSESGIFTPRQ